MPPGMPPEFLARTFDYSLPPAQITGTVEPPIEAQARDVTPAPVKRRDNRHAAFCGTLAFLVAFAVWSVVIGDFRLAMVSLLMTLFMALAGLLLLD